MAKNTSINPLIKDKKFDTGFPNMMAQLPII